jgi:DNA-binding MarR family transcriptional regulator
MPRPPSVAASLFEDSTLPLTIVVITTILPAVNTELQKELKQTRPFASREEEVYLNIQLTAERLWWGVNETLKQADLTHTQYNVLRILRGAGRDGTSCSEISERLVTKDSDITRLLNRLEARGLVARARQMKDRRVITTRITAAGLRLLASLDKPIESCHRRHLGHLGEKQLATLSKLLEAVRGKQG